MCFTITYIRLKTTVETFHQYIFTEPVKTGQNWLKRVKTGLCRSKLDNTGQYRAKNIILTSLHCLFDLLAKTLCRLITSGSKELFFFMYMHSVH